MTNYYKVEDLLLKESVDMITDSLEDNNIYFIEDVDDESDDENYSFRRYEEYFYSLE